MKNHAAITKKTAALMALLLAGALVSGCSDRGSSAVTADAADTGMASVAESSADDVVRPEELIPASLPDADYGGAEFRILIWDADNPLHVYFEFDVEEQNGELLNDAVYNRNAVIEERFGVTITQESENDPSARLKKDVMSGDTAYQIITDWPTRLASASTNGYLLDLYTVPHLQLDAEWWDQNAIQTYTLMDRLYFTSGDYLLYDKQRVLVLFYNRTLAERLDIRDLYTTVFDGKWTIDLFNTCCTDAAYDLNGNGKMGEPEDRFGLLSGSYTYLPYFLMGAGSRYSTTNADGTHSLAIDTEHTVTTIDRYGKTLFDETNTVYMEDLVKKTGENMICMTMFQSGQALFYHEVSQEVRLFDMDDAFGVLPQPKFDETQENYLSAVQMEWSEAMGIPSTLAGETLEMTGVLLEALSAVSSSTTYPAFIEEIMLAKKAPDAESADILRMIHDNLLYDVFGIFKIGGIDQAVMDNLYKKQGKDFMSTIEKRRSRVETDYEKLIDSYSNME